MPRSPDESGAADSTRAGATGTPARGRSRSVPPDGILVYGMYDLAGLGSAPKVRIEMMTRALDGRTHTERVTGGRLARTVAAMGWLLGGGPRRVRAVYVESATTSAMPTDLLFIALMRVLGRPVGVYFRDAYQLFRDLYPRSRRRQVLTDVLWRLSTPLLARLASRRFAASAGLGEALGLRDAVPLGPGTDPAQPDLGSGPLPLVAYVGSTAEADGFGLLLAAMEIAGRSCPDARLLHVGPPMGEPAASRIPGWVEHREAGRADLAGLLREARVCVIPRPINAYSDLAQPVKLWDYMSLGKPVVATAARETAAVLQAGECGLTAPDSPDGLAAALVRVLSDDNLAATLARNARAFAVDPANTWDARARTVLSTLGFEEAAAGTAGTADRA